MTDQSNIKQQLQTVYPELFDDDSAKAKLDTLIAQSNIILKQFKPSVTKQQYSQLLLTFAAHMLYQSEENDIGSVAIADVHVQFNNQNKSNGNGSGLSDPYLDAFARLLNALGLNNDWKIKFD